jgi:fermentation-respiration switch protein FrsA (DUF1100 family)
LRRRLAKLIGTLALGYVGILLMLMFFENWLIFRGVQAKDAWDAPPNSRVQDVYLPTAGGTRIHAWWCPTENWQPSQGALLYAHGNAGNLSQRGEGVRRWQDLMNQAVLIFDYPGYGRSEGKPDEAGCYAAADAAYDWLCDNLRVSPERILLYGGSLGGAVATDLASRRPHRALVLVSAFTSMPDMAQEQYPWTPARWLVRSRFDNLAKIGKVKQPVFQAHGTADRLIPFAQGQRLFAAANERKCFFPMDGYDHNNSPGPDFYAALRKFLQEAETRTSAEAQAVARP